MAISQTVPFRIYDPKEDDFEIFIQRFNAACTANETSEHKKVVILLSLLDSGLLKLGNDLFFPEKMEAQTYELIVKKIRQHLEPKKKIIPQRCLFLKQTQRENESVSEYLRELKHLASNCSFGEMLEMMLRDRFVAGLTSESLQKRLLQEDDEVKLERVFALAVSYELAEKDAKELHEKEVARVTSHIERNRKSKYSPTKENFASATKERTCYRKIGHLSNVCKAKGNAQKSGYVQQQNIFSLKGGTEVKIALTVDGQILNGIVDTGSPVTLMPKSIFEKLWRAKPLIPTALNLKSFCNNPIKVVGERKVFVKEANMSLRLIVVDESIPEIVLGREWLKFLNINYSKLLNVNKISESCIDSLIESYANLFKDELGCLKDVKLDISIKKEEAPVFCKARSLPYSLKKKVEDELECLVERGILEPIVHASWAAPIVPVVKKDGSIRICGDFRSTANKAKILDKYPLPTIDEIFSRLSSSTIFSTLDLSMAYLQIELTDEAKRVVNINTTKGLFAYRRLPYGVAVAPNKFQRLMDNVFADIPGVACYIDDILVSGKDARDHKSKLELVFKRLEEKGLKLNKAKCKFAVDSVEYLGFRIDKNGLHPMLNKIQAVSNAPEPKNIGQLRSFIGMLMYYARFIKDTSSILSPFYQLLKKNCPWKWTNKHRVLFKKCKSLLTDNSVLAHYDPAKELVLACDASSYGLGVVLGHRYKKQESPIAFASRTLTEAEKHYSQLEKEALSIVYGCEKWSLKLGAFHYSVEFRKTEDHGNADALSRLPLKANEGGSYDDDQILLLRKMNEVPFSFQDVAFETKRDKTLAIVLRNVREDTWQSPKFTKENPLSPYYKVRNELSVDFGCLQWKERIVIPPKLRSQILIDLHEMHFGMVKMKIIARRYFWWPGLDRSIEDMARQCTICQETANMPPSMITEWTWPEKPWHRLHLDLAGPFMGKMFLVIVDAYTKWLEIFILRDITSKTIVDCLRQVFARFGLPEFLVTDNGRQFVSREMEEFTRMNGIRHSKPSPYNPSTNGLAERYVREFKTSLKKNNEKDDLETNLQRFLFAHRAFPQSVLKESPAELLMKRRPKSRFSNLMPKMDMKGEGFPDALRNRSILKLVPMFILETMQPDQRYEGQSLKRHINQLRPVKRNPEATVEKEPSLVLPSTSGQELRRESHCEREPSHGGLEIPEEEVTTNELEPQSTRQELTSVGEHQEPMAATSGERIPSRSPRPQRSRRPPDPTSIHLNLQPQQFTQTFSHNNSLKSSARTIHSKLRPQQFTQTFSHHNSLKHSATTIHLNLQPQQSSQTFSHNNSLKPSATTIHSNLQPQQFTQTFSHNNSLNPSATTIHSNLQPQQFIQTFSHNNSLNPSATTIHSNLQPQQFIQTFSHNNSLKPSATSIYLNLQPQQFTQTFSHFNSLKPSATTIYSNLQPQQFTQIFSQNNSLKTSATTIHSNLQPPQFTQTFSHHNSLKHSATTIHLNLQPQQSSQTFSHNNSLKPSATTIHSNLQPQQFTQTFSHNNSLNPSATTIHSNLQPQQFIQTFSHNNSLNPSATTIHSNLQPQQFIQTFSHNNSLKTSACIWKHWIEALYKRWVQLFQKGDFDIHDEGRPGQLSQQTRIWLLLRKLTIITRQ
ncbi:K02A2.6-like [Cordylochernes scorpioides]|uniref:RNA-directed DNA polymerase n=1 Tax=Cordylochernes scorpioides TaxID=51811 RepID=A0ABY6KAV3_9ARAC|nr:K02A2.6-like [Cordylochernes scorpioides]